MLRRTALLLVNLTLALLLPVVLLLVLLREALLPPNGME